MMNTVLNKTNLNKYLEDTYGKNSFYQYGGKVINMEALAQDEYGEDNDCSLVSILTLAKHIEGDISLPYFYNLIERVAKRYFYKGSFGTLPFFIKPIMKRVLPYKVYAKYGKNIGFNFFTIKRQLDYNNPIILSIWNDGRNVYKKHSVVVIGYTAYKINDTMVYILAVYDNWRKEVRYIDYNKLSMISSINYYAASQQ